MVLCGAEWPYTEVRRLALLTPKEMLDFEIILGRLAAQQFCDFKEVSGLIMCTEEEKTRQNVSYPFVFIPNSALAVRPTWSERPWTTSVSTAPSVKKATSPPCSSAGSV